MNTQALHTQTSKPSRQSPRQTIRQPAGTSTPAVFDALRTATVDYLSKAQDLTPGTYYGAFWSEKAYHGPLLDFHAGGAHHNRGAGSAALALMLADNQPDSPLKRQAELAFDWLVSRQQANGGYQEIQNNDKSSNWEHTGLDECSTIATAFAMRSMALALLHGLPPKPLYATTLRDAGIWAINIEWPAGSGIIPHHERSPYDTLNANIHAAEMLMASYRALSDVYGQRLDIFSQAARRAVEHTLPIQHASGCYPYRAGYAEDRGVTINYTAMVTWCLLNIIELGADQEIEWLDELAWQSPMEKAASFLRQSFDHAKGLDWENFEHSTARHNTHTYLLMYNTLKRLGGDANLATCAGIEKFLLKHVAADGLLPVKDVGEPITLCLPMQADMLLCMGPREGQLGVL